MNRPRSAYFKEAERIESIQAKGVAGITQTNE